MTDHVLPKIRIPHWRWFIIATGLIAVAGIGINLGIPLSRQYLTIASFRARGIKVATGQLPWLPSWVGDDWNTVFCSPKIIDARGGKSFDDVDLQRLAALKSLQGLWLDETQVTDAGLIHLNRSPKLVGISLRGTQVTPAGIAKLKSALPGCDIIGP